MKNNPKPFVFCGEPIAISITNCNSSAAPVHLFSTNLVHNSGIEFDMVYKQSKLSKLSYQDLLEKFQQEGESIKIAALMVHTIQGANVHVLPYKVHYSDGSSELNTIRINPMQMQTGIIEITLPVESPIEITKDCMIEFMLPATTKVDFCIDESLN